MLVALILWVLLAAAVVSVNIRGTWNRLAATLLILAVALTLYITATAAF